MSMRERRSTRLAWWWLVCGALLAVPCGPSEAETLRLRGAKTVCEPLAEVAPRLREELGFDLKISSTGGSQAGVIGAAMGSVDLGCVARSLTVAERKVLTQHVVARDRLVLVASKGIDVRSLSTAQVRDALTGQVERWSEIDPSLPAAPARLVVSEGPSGTRTAILKFLGHAPLADDTILVSSMTQAFPPLLEDRPVGAFTLVSPALLARHGSGLRATVVRAEEETDGTRPFERVLGVVYRSEGGQREAVEKLIAYLADHGGEIWGDAAP